jgi:tetratricopeptide (TPR) repeat protein
MMRLRLWLPCASLALCIACGCGEARDPAQEQAFDAREWLEQIERAHDKADREPPLETIVALRDALALPVPSDARPLHRRVVHQDLWFRLARAQIAAGRFVEGLDASARGLALGHAPDIFTANLHVARGEALEGLGRATEAASAYYEALEINRKLLHDALPAQDSGLP